MHMDNSDFMYQTDFEPAKEKRIELSPKRIDLRLKYEKTYSNTVRIPKALAPRRKVSSVELRKQIHLPTIFKNPLIPGTSTQSPLAPSGKRRRLHKHCNSINKATLYPRSLKYSLILDNFYLSST